MRKLLCGAGYTKLYKSQPQKWKDSGFKAEIAEIMSYWVIKKFLKHCVSIYCIFDSSLP